MHNFMHLSARAFECPAILSVRMISVKYEKSVGCCRTSIFRQFARNIGLIWCLALLDLFIYAFSAHLKASCHLQLLCHLY